ncbi:MAG: hypothetical protein ACPLXM_11815 [Bacteroidales bacterium]
MDLRRFIVTGYMVFKRVRKSALSGKSIRIKLPLVICRSVFRTTTVSYLIRVTHFYALKDSHG